MDLGTLIFFAVALSLDAFSAGFAYGLRKIKIPLLSYLALLCVSMLIVGSSVFCGGAVANLLPDIWCKKLGGIILIGIGLLWFFRLWGKNEANTWENGQFRTVASFRLASLAVVIQIFEEPMRADIDASGEISFKEALFLAFALSLDALGAVFGASLAGLGGILTVVLIGFFQQFFLMLGVLFGRSSTMVWLRSQGPLLASILLCILGLFKIINAGG